MWTQASVQPSSCRRAHLHPGENAGLHSYSSSLGAAPFSSLCRDVHHHGNARGEITQVLASGVSLWSLGKWRAGSWCHRKEDALKTTQAFSIPFGDFPFKS